MIYNGDFNQDLPRKNGLIGAFNGWCVNGKTYDADGNQIDEVHGPDCFCCRKLLLGK